MRVYGGADCAPRQQQEDKGANLSLRLELKQGERTIYPGEWQPLAPLVVKRDAKGPEVGGQLKLTLSAGIYELNLSVQDAKRKKTMRGSIPFAVETPALPENSLRRGGS